MKKRVLVVGASGGLGQAIVTRLARDGFQLAIHYRSQKSKAQELLSSLNGHSSEHELVAFDSAQRSKTQSVIQSDMEKNGPYWGVVYAAGVIADNPFPALTGEDWDLVIRTNLDGLYNVL